MGRVAKGKRTTRGKKSKASKCTDKHDKELKYRQFRQAAFLGLFASFPPSKDGLLLWVSTKGFCLQFCQVRDVNNNE